MFKILITIFYQAKQYIQNQYMQKGKSKKKQRTNLQKVASATSVAKKTQTKKLNVTKKQETLTTQKKQQIKRNGFHTANNSNSKLTSGNSTDVRSSKYVQQSLRTSPKTSLAEINSINLKRHEQQIKSKFQSKTPSKLQDALSSKIKQEVKKSLANVIKVYRPDNSYLDISMTQITDQQNIKNQKLTRGDFNFLTVIGEGGYGKVWKVQHHKNRTTYAMKQMCKALIIMKKSAENVINQMKILSKLQNPFISNIRFAFNDRDNLYLGMDYLPGGDLRSFLCSYQPEKLNEDESKFLIACVIKSLQYIHQNKVFHRDIKPQNLVLDQLGYLRLTDFGIARSLRENQCLDSSGTPGYMAPEVLCKQIHSYPVDFYALGIIAYELMIGRRPYTGQNRNQIRDIILSKQHSIKKKQIPANWSLQSGDFINKLIQRVPAQRLGSKQGVQQLKLHPWFINFPWKQLEQRKLISPFKLKYKAPAVTDRMDDYDEAVHQYKLLQRTEQKVDVFSGYFFNLK